MILLLYLLLGLITVSFVEYSAHRWVMHKRIWFMQDHWFFHAVLHHSRFYRLFNYEPDDYGRLVNLRFTWAVALGFMLIFLPIYFLDWRAGIIFSTVALCESRIWNTIHSEMHLEEGRFFSNWRAYRYLKWWHFLHHRQPRKNFNAVLPFWDFIFGTVAVPTPKDYQKWLEIHHAATTAFPVQDNEV